jgi:deoxyadenosine/deoxycytidine kinase
MSLSNNVKGFILNLEGVISVGKSTLGNSLKKRGHFLGRPVVFIKEYDNPMLPLYLKKREKYAFPFQIVALRERFNTHREAERLAAEGYCVVIDRGLPGDLAFALMQKEDNFFSEEEWEVYWKTILEHRDTKWKPDLVIFLECSPEQAFDRLRKRGNQDEIDNYTLEYFQQLRDSHEKAFKLYDEVTGDPAPMLRIDWSKDESINRTSSKLNMSVDGVLPETSLEEFEKLVVGRLLVDKLVQDATGEAEKEGKEPTIFLDTTLIDHASSIFMSAYNPQNPLRQTGSKQSETIQVTN